jgi:hypothetical protein
MAYNVYLCDILGAVNDKQTMLQTNRILQNYFQRVASGTRHGSAFVHWLAYMPTVQNHELLIYFMPETHSIVQVMLGRKLGGTMATGGHWGMTWTSGQPPDRRTASEVYVKLNDPQMLANLAFHEAMHNKLQFSSRQLHNGDGMGGTPYRSEQDVGGEVTSTTLVTPTNIAAMARALDNSVPQWTNGISYLIARRQMRDSRDIMWDA